MAENILREKARRGGGGGEDFTLGFFAWPLKRYTHALSENWLNLGTIKLFSRRLRL